MAASCRADKIVAEIEKLLLAERIAGQADLNDGTVEAE